MKKIIFIVFCTILSTIAFTQSNIPNGNLENWYNIVVNDTLNFDQPGVGPSDNWLTTLNELAAIAAPIGPGPVSAYKTTDTHSGNYACKLVSQNFILVPNDVFIPGMLGTTKIHITTSNAALGRTCPGCRPLNLSGWYKYQPVNGDSATAVILLSKWNTTAHKRDTIGYGKLVQKEVVSSYTQFIVPVNYRNSDSPDSLTVLAISSGAFNVINFMHSQGQVGSTMYVDDLTIEYPAGIQQNLMSDVNVSVYPNPASDQVTLTLSERIEKGFVEVFSLDGKQIGTYGINGLNAIIPVYSFTNGTYFFKLRQENQIVNTGSFIIKK